MQNYRDCSHYSLSEHFFKRMVTEAVIAPLMFTVYWWTIPLKTARDPCFHFNCYRWLQKPICQRPLMYKMYLPFWKHCIRFIQRLSPLFKPSDTFCRFTPELLGFVTCQAKRVFICVFRWKCTNTMFPVYVKSYVCRINQRFTPIPDICLYLLQVTRSKHTCAWKPQTQQTSWTYSTHCFVTFLNSRHRYISNVDVF